MLAIMSISFQDTDGNKLGLFYPKRQNSRQRVVGDVKNISAKADIHAEPDTELLEFQKQRKTPMVKLSEMNHEGAEIVHAEVEDFGA